MRRIAATRKCSGIPRWDERRRWASVLLHAVDLTVSYARGRQSTAAHAAIQRLSLEIARGSLLGILGPNGSGKTTLLRLLAGTLAPDAGQVLLDGVDVRRIPRA